MGVVERHGMQHGLLVGGGREQAQRSREHGEAVDAPGRPEAQCRLERAALRRDERVETVEAGREDEGEPRVREIAFRLDDARLDHAHAVGHRDPRGPVASSCRSPRHRATAGWPRDACEPIPAGGRWPRSARRGRGACW